MAVLGKKIVSDRKQPTSVVTGERGQTVHGIGPPPHRAIGRWRHSNRRIGRRLLRGDSQGGRASVDDVVEGLAGAACGRRA
jgi:hypothetical protein